MSRVIVYTDYTYTRAGATVYAERAFALFVFRLAEEVDRLILMGKVDPHAGASHYPVPSGVDFRELPFFSDATGVRRNWRPMLGSLRGFWAALTDADVAWLLGPHPVALIFALLALARRRAVRLGVRQDFRRYVRARHPGRRWVHLAGDGLDLLWSGLARWLPVVAVGPEITAQYPHGETLEIAVSLVGVSDLRTATDPGPDYEEAELWALSVGRLEAEKNPLLLADIAAALRESRWRLAIVGEGPMESELRASLDALGVGDRVRLLGYVPWDGGLAELYRSSHALLHVSLTEGVPQILFEAFAARLPVVATAVGGVAAVAGDGALLIEPRNAGAAADALDRIAADPELRRRLADAGSRRVGARTLDIEVARVRDFLAPREPERQM